MDDRKIYKQEDVLAERRRTWHSKEVIRRLYDKWCGHISKAVRPGKKVIELGGGSGNLANFFPDTIRTDILFEPWLDAVLDAHRLPFKSESLDAIVLFDVLHHLKAPLQFFKETERVLRPRGRIVMMEPYISWSSFLIYHFFHQEGMNWHVNPFRMKDLKGKKDPFFGNQAIPTLIFEKYRRSFMHLFPGLDIIHEGKMDCIIYPLSGGFHHPSFCPKIFWKAFDYMEGLLKPLNRFLAFRLFVVLEKN